MKRVVCAVLAAVGAWAAPAEAVPITYVATSVLPNDGSVTQTFTIDYSNTGNSISGVGNPVPMYSVVATNSKAFANQSEEFTSTSLSNGGFYVRLGDLYAGFLPNEYASILGFAVDAAGLPTGSASLMYQDQTSPTVRAYATSSYVALFGSAVPEASQWAMMIAGLGLVGCALRRRHEHAGSAVSFA